MSNFRGSVNIDTRLSVVDVQKWLLMPIGAVTEWAANGFPILGEHIAQETIFFASEIRMLFEAETKIEVYVQDEHRQPLAGVKVDHGWPAHKWPEFDESVMRVTGDDGKVEWAIFAEFDPIAEIGPLWVALHGDSVSDVVLGMGIPETFHYRGQITYQIVFRKQVLKHEVRA